MAEQFQINGDKPPTSKGNNSVKHSGLFWLSAYIPLALIGVQGISLSAYLDPHPRAFSLGLFLFGIYLFEGMGLLSPEDLVNQPARFQFFKRNKKKALSLFALSIFGGLFLLWMLAPPILRPLAALMGSGTGFVLYSLFRWKLFGLLKPLLVSLSWVLALWGFSLVDFSGNEKVYFSLFLLLFLDSLWLDLKDLPGDAAYGFNVEHLKKSPILGLVILHILLGGYFTLVFSSRDPLFISNGILLFCGVVGIKYSSRWFHGVLVPLWSLYLVGVVFVS